MFNFIGRKGRLSDVAERLFPLVLAEDTIGRQAPTSEALAAIAPLEENDRRIYERAKSEIEAQNAQGALEVILGAGGSVESMPAASKTPLSAYLQWDESEKLAWSQRALESVAETLEEGQVRAMPDERKVSLACVRGGRPVRLDVHHGYTADFEVKLENRRGHLLLQYEADKQPTGVFDPSDPFYDEAAKVCRVYGSGVYIEAQASAAEPMFALMDEMPEPLGRKLIECAEDVHFLMAAPDAVRMRHAPFLWLVNRESIGWVIDTLVEVADHFSEGDAAAAGMQQNIVIGGVAATPVIRHTCAYCQTMFSYTDDPNCPTCGAPAKRSD